VASIPFPFEELRKAVREAEVLVVVDRAVSFGGPGGPFCSEVRAAMYHEEKRPVVTNFIAGLGGRDITVAGFARGLEIAEKGIRPEYEMYGVRE